MLRLFYGLVVAVAEFRRAAWQPAREIQQAALEHVLEDHTDLHEVGQHAKTDPRTDSCRLRAVPFGRAEHVVRFEFPSRIVVIDAELRIVPLDVRVRIEMFHHRLVAEPANQIEVGVGLDRFLDTLLFRSNKLFGHQILPARCDNTPTQSGSFVCSREHYSSLLMLLGANCFLTLLTGMPIEC